MQFRASVQFESRALATSSREVESSADGVAVRKATKQREAEKRNFEIRNRYFSSRQHPETFPTLRHSHHNDAMTTPGNRILAIAVIGKTGNPLFIKAYAKRTGGEADLKWHYAAHTSLDYFEERGQFRCSSSVCIFLSPLAPDLPAAKTTDTYLGLLYAMEDYAVFVP